MMAERQYDAPTAADLAWHADRRSLVDLDDETRTILEEAAAWLAEIWPEDELGEIDIDLGEHGEGKCWSLAVWDDFLDELEKAGIKPEHDEEGEVTPAHVGKAIGERLEREREEGRKDALVPSRKSAAMKARILLLEGRVQVIRRDHAGELSGLVHAKVRGDSGKVYDTGYDPRGNGQWRCTCQEMRGDCSHIAALKLIVTV